MSYDLVIGIGNKVKNNPVVIGKIEYDELPMVSSLVKRQDSFFLTRISNLFEDESFSVDELREAQSHLFELMLTDLKPQERQLLHKLIAVVAYALSLQLPLHGVAD
ncbi:MULTISPECIES: hypothetical protein [Ralstonia solanacearum species complex]|uniref:Uncharacterized protein n=2 Tax=Ralstonia solanacearum species complex TaxID=3116862 RepID=A0A0S4WXT5_RALSL|nr:MULTISPECIES: hypothetical protein [Ralstonia]APF86038.1 hypothetical protein BCR16_04165 [Ralstonia solanacearum FJAT-1458]ARS57044.1 hypothetical protein BC427_13480 [Ralstonia solanacearum FJAT-91]AVV68112.1 hypothetical protein RSOE_21545 [Ralstonia solanacearum OE1-1]AXV68507.1 hypothetical protein CJO74_03980 [Ralstonia solanacearum]API73781.1 hypothetical protein AC251_04010 [Ralstonia pseudosolanacearum]